MQKTHTFPQMSTTTKQCKQSVSKFHPHLEAIRFVRSKNILYDIEK